MKGIVALVAAVAAIAVLPGFVESYGLSFLVQTLIFVCLAYSWNLIGGYAGYAHFVDILPGLKAGDSYGAQWRH